MILTIHSGVAQLTIDRSASFAIFTLCLEMAVDNEDRLRVIRFYDHMKGLRRSERYLATEMARELVNMREMHVHALAAS